jgi:hypothetical protein
VQGIEGLFFMERRTMSDILSPAQEHCCRRLTVGGQTTVAVMLSVFR